MNVDNVDERMIIVSTGSVRRRHAAKCRRHNVQAGTLTFAALALDNVVCCRPCGIKPEWGYALPVPSPYS